MIDALDFDKGAGLIPAVVQDCRTLQVLMLVGLLHLITQGVWAMAVPFLMMFVPTWAALRWAVRQPFRRRPLAGTAGAGLAEAPVLRA